MKFDIFRKRPAKKLDTNSNFGELENPAPQKRGGAEQSLSKNELPTFSENRKFVSYSMAPELKPSQTFEIILPNLIHKSKNKT
ncbi:MAG: hypothetical protein A3B96_02860 [Candidatus Spechtbacteria bacterium RIFCSPHIGHO2_02_FULL_43_15b]|uniref:Uncharacterized protein n=1 Tax=Candidatus Spechtbacteria bacterium RIFCSPHIGHO2_01_FULL_43_30 TaxID=1802158 RepID=A0A1G2H5P0_9BACT|nr:MAG: hypothetical protein A2827_01490 [Candidatus Spechtbacteria bacterium RIFCSPHIGHO2_01_FULL_43_30]OGZ59927.1 MAG: hypothetical protein A3B96_02860 [Candidatus Spechtbacteria bacterium RIFCSPHIGHO2_02_FULL_43_15b]